MNKLFKLTILVTILFSACNQKIDTNKIEKEILGIHNEMIEAQKKGCVVFYKKYC